MSRGDSGAGDIFVSEEAIGGALEVGITREVRSSEAAEEEEEEEEMEEEERRRRGSRGHAAAGKCGVSAGGYLISSA